MKNLILKSDGLKDQLHTRFLGNYSSAKPYLRPTYQPLRLCRLSCSKSQLTEFDIIQPLAFYPERSSGHFSQSRHYNPVFVASLCFLTNICIICSYDYSLPISHRTAESTINFSVDCTLYSFILSLAF